MRAITECVIVGKFEIIPAVRPVQQWTIISVRFPQIQIDVNERDYSFIG